MRERLIELRNALGMNITAFSKSINVSKSFISLFESGQRDNLSTRTINDICEVHNVNEEWLLYGKGNMFRPLGREQEIAKLTKILLKVDEDDYFAKLVTNLALLDMDEWKELNRIIKKLLKDQEKDSSEN